MEETVVNKVKLFLGHMCQQLSFIFIAEQILNVVSDGDQMTDLTVFQENLFVLF